MPKIAMHRGSTSTMTSTAKKNIVLEDGELFVEVPDSITDSNQYKFKVGDGVSTYENLPYALDPTAIKSKSSINENLIQTNVTLSTLNPTQVSFTDESIKTTSNIEVYTTQDVPFSSITKSNGNCIVMFPKQTTSKTVNVMIKIVDDYIKNINISNFGNADVENVIKGYTFSSENGKLLTGTAEAGSDGPIVELGTSVYGDITGSHTRNNYEFKVCYVSSTEICLIGQTSLLNAPHIGARGYTWTVTFPAGTLFDTAKTITGVKIPTMTQIRDKCCGWYLPTQPGSWRYWTSDYYWRNNAATGYISSDSTDYAWCVDTDGSVNYSGVSASFGVVPYIVIPL